MSGQRPIKNTLTIALRNDSASHDAFAYITGQALDHGNAIYLLEADGKTAYYPTSPSKIGSPLAKDVAIPLGAPGHTVTVEIPHIAGGRIWFSIGSKLTFLLNPGPALVEPSVTNPTDPSAHVDWAFCEFTFNNDQLYANISYVDFVSLPVSLTLTTESSGTQHVAGMHADGLSEIAADLRAQHAKDGQGWDKLIVPRQDNPSQTLRILSPNVGKVQDPSLLQHYFHTYVDAVYNKYAHESLAINTQSGFGIVKGRSEQNNSVLRFGDITFPKPSTADIWTCSTGPFATGSNAEKNAIIPRLSAAFNRSTLLASDVSPSNEGIYYQDATTNHYARIVHANQIDGKGYAFPYDDVQPDGGKDVSGKVQAGDPKVWTVSLGGAHAN